MGDHRTSPPTAVFDAANGGAPLWIDSPDGPLFGWFHAPVGGTARASVLICPSLAREQIAGYAACRELATQFTRAGFAVLRFDYFGTGDSAGDLAGRGAIQACQRGIAAASEWLRNTCGGPMTVVGLRMGGTLAVSAVRLGLLAPEAVVLWDPAKSGQRWLRHQVVLHRLFIAERSAERALVGVEVAGFLYEDAMASAFSSLRLGSINNSLASRLLLLGSDEINSIRSEPWDGLTVKNPAHRAEFLDVSTIVSAPPTATTAVIVDWCANTFAPADYPTRAWCPTETFIAIGDGSVIRERAVRFGPAALFGLISEPVGSARGPVPILLNVGIEPHVGPVRLWVELSRRWAAAGVRSVRVDLSGLGDSDPADGAEKSVSFPSDGMSDMRQVASVMSPEGPSGLIWVGLCSGAYHALEAAAGIGAAGAFVVNPALIIAPREDDHRPEPWRQICSFVPAWARDDSLAPETYLKSKRHFSGLIYRSLYRLGLRAAPAGGLTQLNRNSGNTFIVSGPFEAKPLTWLKLGKRVGLYRSTRLKIIDNLQHSLLTPQQREQVSEMATRWLFDDVMQSAAVEGGKARDLVGNDTI